MREMSVSLEVKEKLIEEFIEALGSVSASSPFKAIYRRALVYYRLTYPSGAPKQIKEYVEIYNRLLELREKVEKFSLAFNRKLIGLRRAKRWTKSINLIQLIISKEVGGPAKIEVLPCNDLRVRNKFAIEEDDMIYINGEATRLDLWMYITHLISMERLGKEEVWQIDIEILRYVKSFSFTIREIAKRRKGYLKEYLENIADIMEFYALEYELNIHTARLQVLSQGREFLEKHRLKILKAPKKYIEEVAKSLETIIEANFEEKIALQLNTFIEKRVNLKSKIFDIFRKILRKKLSIESLVEEIEYKITARILRFIRKKIREEVSKAQFSLAYKETMRKPLENVCKIKKAGVAVGIPFYTEKDTVGNVFLTLMEGVAQFYPKERSIIIPIGEAVSGELLSIIENIGLFKNIYRIAFLKDRLLKGKGWSMRMMMEIAKELGADICFVDADERRVTPQWPQLLLMPIKEYGFDYVCPRYTRHHHSATITNHLLYPLIASIYGKKIRQPIGGEFGVSKGLIEIYLRDPEIWFTEVGTYGVDNWLTTEAIVNGAKIAEVDLGVKAHAFSDFKKRERMFRQVAEITFEGIIRNAWYWKKITKIEEIPLIGELKEEEPEVVPQDWKRWISRFKKNFSLYVNVYEEVLSPEEFKELMKISIQDLEKVHLPQDLWAQIVFDFILYYAFGKEFTKEELLSALMRISQARVGSFVKETPQDLPYREAEKLIQGAADEFILRRQDFVGRYKKEENKSSSAIKLRNYYIFLEERGYRQTAPPQGISDNILNQSIPSTSSPVQSNEIIKQLLDRITRSYDFRSKNADRELTEEVIEVWAKGLVKFQRGLLDKDKLVCVIGYDIRHSSERISAKLIDT
ncbi:MAG: hypothetical protein DRP80_07605, partial [Candidatus Omnitrophota bacterium]